MTRVPRERGLAQLAKVPQWPLSSHRWIPWPTEAEPCIRLLIDNDFAGDPDDLFQIVRHLLSQSVDIQAIICSQLGPDDSDRRAAAADALLVARHVFHRMRLDVRTEDGDVSSNEFVGKSAQHSTDAGTYADQHGVRTMRVYTTLDYRVMFEDFFMKLREFAAGQRTAGNGC